MSTDFYGDADNAVEAMLAKAEGKMSQILVALDGGADPRPYERELCAFAWSLTVRTRALRGQFSAAIQRIAESVAERPWHDAAYKKALLEKAHAELDKQIEEVFSGLPVQRRALARILAQQSGMLDAAHKMCDERMAAMDFGKAAAQFVEALRSQNVFESSAKNGQIRGLAQLLREDHIPDSFTSISWAIGPVVSGSVILGDSCLIAASPAGEFGSLARFGVDGWQAIYLPISPTSVLYGSQGSEPHAVAPDVLNRASAELSQNTFFASKRDEQFSELAGSIGRQAYLVRETDIASLATDFN